MNVVGALPLRIPFKQLSRKARRDQAMILDRRAGRRRVALHRDGNRLIQMLFYPGGLEVENEGVLGAERVQRAPPARAVHSPHILQFRHSVRPGVRRRRPQGNYGQVFALLGDASLNRGSRPAIDLAALHRLEPFAVP